MTEITRQQQSTRRRQPPWPDAPSQPQQRTRRHNGRLFRRIRPTTARNTPVYRRPRHPERRQLLESPRGRSAVYRPFDSPCVVNRFGRYWRTSPMLLLPWNTARGASVGRTPCPPQARPIGESTRVALLGTTAKAIQKLTPLLPGGAQMGTRTRRIRSPRTGRLVGCRARRRHRLAGVQQRHRSRRTDGGWKASGRRAKPGPEP